MNREHLRLVVAPPRLPKDPAGRPPPHDLEAERAVLGWVVHWGTARGLSDLLSREDFFSDQHGALWAMVLELEAQDTDPSERALATMLRDRGELTPDAERALREIAQVGGRTQRRGLEDVARRVAMLGLRRRLLAELWRAVAESYDLDIGDAREWMQALSLRISRLAHQSTVVAQASLQAATAEAIDELQNPSHQHGMRTGFGGLDEQTAGGLHRQETTLLSGPTGRGKSAFATRLARNIAGDGHGVIVFQLEDSARSYATRMLIAEALADAHAVRMGSVDPREVGAILAAADIIQRLPIRIVQADEAITPQAIRGHAERCKAELEAKGIRLGLVVVDYLQLVDGRELVGPRETRERELSATAKYLMRLAEKLDVSLLALCQTNGEGEIRESRAILQHAQNWWDIQRPKPGKNHREGDAEHAFVRIRKQRHGRADVNAPFWFHARSVLFSDDPNPMGLGR